MPAPRSAYRFRIQEPLKGRFGNVNVSICDLSERGLQIEHVEALPQGYSATLSYTIPGRERQIDLHGEIRWSVPDASGAGLGFRSGVSIDANSEALSSSLDLFIRKGIARLDRGKKGPSEARVVVSAGKAEETSATADSASVRSSRNEAGVNPVEQRAVQQARERLASSFDESLRWYNRARYALAEEPVRRAVEGIRHKEDVLAVWEFLGRTIDIATIARAFDRRTY